MTDLPDKWLVDIKGSPGETFEISVLRSSYEHGKESYGWFAANKLLISEGGTAWSVTPLVFKKLKKVAEEVAKELNMAEGQVSNENNQ